MLWMFLAGSMCTKRFSYEDRKLQRLCVGDNCQCMAGTTAVAGPASLLHHLTFSEAPV